MKFVVTGGAGFIGSALVEFLVNEGHYVLAIDNLVYAGSMRNIRFKEDRLKKQFELAKVDVREKDTIKSIIKKFHPDRILHLAAETHVDRSILNPQSFIETNILGTAVLLEAAMELQNSKSDGGCNNFRFIQMSTDEVFGDLKDTGEFTEESFYKPSSPYSASKASADHLVSSWGRTYGLNYNIVHAANNYGPYQNIEKLIPKTIVNALSSQPILIYGDGENVRDWVFVEDTARAIVEIALRGRPNTAYNVGANTEKTNIFIVEKICNELNWRVPLPDKMKYQNLIKFVTDRLGHDYRYALCTDKIQKEIGWKPLVDFEIGLNLTVDWYIKQHASTNAFQTN